MGRKEINVFGTSFLDLLSGALAAVIILFIIVPKMTPDNIDALEKVKKIEAVVESIDAAIEQIKNTVPKEVYDQIEKQLNDLKQQIITLAEELENLKQDIVQITQENEQMKTVIAEKDAKIEELTKELEELRKKLEDAESKNTALNNVEQTLGVFAQFGIIVSWDELDTDVDMGVQCFSPQEHVWRMYPSKSWGILGQDVRERADNGNELFELFYVPEIHDGVYTAWVDIYSESRGKSATVKSIMIFHPGKKDERRLELSPFTIGSHEKRCFVTFRLSDSGFEILSHREPIWGSGVVEK